MLLLEQYAQQILDFVRDHKDWAAPIVFLLAFGESIAFVSLILPFWAMLVGLGTLVQASGLSFPLMLASAAIGAALGDWLSYWLGYYFHEQISKIWPLSKYPDLLPQGHAFMEKYGAWAIVFGRFSGPLRASVPLAAGIFEMERWKFQLANWSSAFLWAFILLYFGDVISTFTKWLWQILGWS